MLKFVMSLSLLLLANAAFADCANIINTYRVELYKTGITPVVSHSGVGDAFRIVDELKELELISDARDGRDSKVLGKFHDLVNDVLSHFEPNKKITREELISEIVDANYKNQICGQYYGAMSLSQAASVIATRFARP